MPAPSQPLKPQNAAASKETIRQPKPAVICCAGYCLLPNRTSKQNKPAETSPNTEKPKNLAVFFPTSIYPITINT